jgi:hypothetical protein
METNPFKLNKKSLKETTYPELEEKLFTWFRRNESKHAVITGDVIVEKAKAYASEFGLSNFKASLNWYNSFKKLHGIDQKVRHGDGGSADMVYVHIAQAGLPILLKDVNPQDIYNMDETGLNFRTLPDKSLATGKVFGYVRAKDRITVVLCVNSTGTHKLDPMIIGSAAWPRCFNMWQPERDGKVLYASNKSSWMTSEEFVRWINYFNEEMKELRKKGWIIMDNCSSHSKPPDAEPCVWDAEELRFRGFTMSHTNAVYLPPKTTSWVEPLDQGIIRAFKAIYCRSHVRGVLALLDSGKVQNACRARFDMRIALEWARAAWEELSVKTVKILPSALAVAGPDDTVVNELAALLMELQGSGFWLTTLWTTPQRSGRKRPWSPMRRMQA